MDLTQFMYSDGERPLDRIVSDGGFCSIFRHIACVGDSLSSGEYESLNAEGKKGYHDMFDHSWGQHIARSAGCTVYNFSKGGMTAKQYCNSFAEEKGFWNPELKAEAYIIALGVNDVIGKNRDFGTVDDICLEDYSKNADSFAGYYGKIIQRYKEIQPDAKFFLMSAPHGFYTPVDDDIKKLSALLNDMAKLFTNTYVLDFEKYAPVYDEQFRHYFFMGGHMNPMGYVLTAKMVMSYIDYIIRKNPRDFTQVGFIGTPWKNPTVQ